MHSQSNYISKILACHNKNILDPAIILKELLEEYQSENKSNRQCSANEELMLNKLVAFLKHNNDLDHMLAVIKEINQTAKDNNLVEADLLNLLSAFFSVYDRYFPLLSNEAISKLQIDSFMKELFSQQIKNIIFRIHYCDVGAATVLEKIWKDIEDDTEIRNLTKKMIEILGNFSVSEVTADSYQLAIAVAKMLDKLDRYIPENQRSNQIAGLIKLLGLKQNDDDIVEISKSVANIKKFVSIDARAKLSKELLENYKQNKIPSLQSILYLSDFVDPEQGELFVKQLIEDLKDTNQSGHQRSLILKTLVEYKRFIKDVDDQVCLVDEIIKLLRIDLNILRKDACEIICQFKEFIKDDDRKKTLIDTLLQSIAVDRFETDSARKAILNLTELKDFGPKFKNTNDLVDFLLGFNCEFLEKQEAFGEIRNYIPKDKLEDLVRILLDKISSHQGNMYSISLEDFRNNKLKLFKAGYLLAYLDEEFVPESLHQIFISKVLENYNNPLTKSLASFEILARFKSLLPDNIINKMLGDLIQEIMFESKLSQSKSLALKYCIPTLTQDEKMLVMSKLISLFNDSKAPFTKELASQLFLFTYHEYHSQLLQDKLERYLGKIKVSFWNNNQVEQRHIPAEVAEMIANKRAI